jgi:hypothetical protein
MEIISRRRRVGVGRVIGVAVATVGLLALAAAPAFAQTSFSIRTPSGPAHRVVLLVANQDGVAEDEQSEIDDEIDGLETEDSQPDGVENDDSSSKDKSSSTSSHHSSGTSGHDSAKSSSNDDNEVNDNDDNEDSEVNDSEVNDNHDDSDSESGGGGSAPNG